MCVVERQKAEFPPPFLLPFPAAGKEKGDLAPLVSNMAGNLVMIDVQINKKLFLFNLAKMVYN